MSARPRLPRLALALGVLAAALPAPAAGAQAPTPPCPQVALTDPAGDAAPTVLAYSAPGPSAPALDITSVWFGERAGRPSAVIEVAEIAAPRSGRWRVTFSTPAERYYFDATAASDGSLEVRYGLVDHEGFHEVGTTSGRVHAGSPGQLELDFPARLELPAGTALTAVQGYTSYAALRGQEALLYADSAPELGESGGATSYLGRCGPPPLPRRAPALAGTVTAAAASSSSMLVRLPADVAVESVLAADEEAKFGSLPAAGLLTGLMLHRLEPSGGEQPLLLAMKSAFETHCHSSCDRPRRDGFFWQWAAGPRDQSRPEMVVLPEGLYRLTVIAPERPARIMLRLPGLAGTRRLRPRERHDVTALKLEPRGQDGEPFGVFGALGAMRSRGLLFDLALGFDRRHIASRTEWCLYAGDEAASGGLAYYPTCPGAETSFAGSDSYLVAGPGGLGMDRATVGQVGLALTGAGTWGQGGNTSHISELDSFGWVAAWLPFEPGAELRG